MSQWLYPKVSEDSLRGWATKVKAKISGGDPSDDNKYPVRLIERELREQYYLATYEDDRQKEVEGVLPNKQREYPFPCIDLVDSKDFYCACTKSGGKFKKAVLPKFIQWRGTTLMSYLGNTDLDLSFTDLKTIQGINSNIGLINRPAYFISGHNAYVALPLAFKEICQITVLGIPEDPTATSGPCFDVWSTEFKVAGYIRTIVEERTIRALNPMMQTQALEDKRNNSQSGNDFPTITQ